MIPFSSSPKNMPITKFLISRTQLIFISSFFFITIGIYFLNFPLKSNPLSNISSSSTFSKFTSHLFSLENFTTSSSDLPTPSSITTTPPTPPVFASAPEYSAPSSGSRVKDGSTTSKASSCDMFDGRWVYDDTTGPIYPPGSCPYVGDSFNCFKSGRRDPGYLKYRWQPYGCDIPRFDGRRMVEMLRGKRMVFVGDSLNRNMWDSLICSLGNISSSGRRVMKHDWMSFEIKDYDCSIVLVTSPFLVRQWKTRGSTHSDTPIDKVQLDVIHDAIAVFRDADFLIFNTGHWWNHGKVQNGENFFQEGEVVHKKLDMGEAFEKALSTWGKWIDNDVNENKTKVFFVGYTAMHFRGGDWNSGGTCHGETKPIANETLLQPYPWMMKTLEQVISKMSTPVTYLNITKLTDYRSDGHPSIYRRPGYKWSPGRPQDCSHWCLPGVPDSWNQLLFASLLSSFGTTS